MTPVPSHIALRDDSIFKLSLRYTIPTSAAMLVIGIYVTVDGMFVGHFIGEQGLAGIMLGYPISSVLVAIKLGEDHTQRA